MLASGCLLLCLEMGCGGITRSETRDRAEEPTATAQGGGPEAGSTAGGSASAATAPSMGTAGTVDCGCVSASIAWWVESDHPPDGLRGKGHVKDCMTYEYSSEPVGKPPTVVCDSPLDACEIQFGVAAVNGVLAHPDVQAALASSPAFFGLDLRPAGGQVDHIEVNGNVIEIGGDCIGDAPCRMPPGIDQLDHFLGRMVARYGTCAP